MELRPGYKQTEIGVIPEDWALKPLRLISPRQSVGLVINPSTYYDNSGTVPLLVGSNVAENLIDVTSANRISEASNALLTASQLSTGDIVMVRVGDPGVSAVVPPELDGCNCASMMIVRKHGSYDSNWLCAAMNSSIGRRQVEGVQYGTAQKQFNISDAVDFVFPVPPLPEQSAIATALSDVDALLAAQDALIAKKRAIKQGAMQELLTGKRRLPGFSGEWLFQRLGTAAVLKARIGWQGLTTAEYLDSGDYYLVTGTDFLEGKIDWANCACVTKSRYDQDPYIQIFPRDVLVTKDGTIGKIAIVDTIDKPGTLNSGVFVVRPKGCSFVPEFFYYLLQSEVFDKFLAQLSAGSTINHLYQKDFVGFAYQLPPTAEEQIAIAEVLRDMDSEIADLEAKRSKSALLKHGMMQALLTGRIRLV